MYIHPQKVILSKNEDTEYSNSNVSKLKQKILACIQKTQIQLGKYIKNGQILTDGTDTISGNLLSESTYSKLIWM